MSLDKIWGWTWIPSGANLISDTLSWTRAKNFFCEFMTLILKWGSHVGYYFACEHPWLAQPKADGGIDNSNGRNSSLDLRFFPLCLPVCSAASFNSQWPEQVPALHGQNGSKQNCSVHRHGVQRNTFCSQGSLLKWMHFNVHSSRDLPGLLVRRFPSECRWYLQRRFCHLLDLGPREEHHGKVQKTVFPFLWVALNINQLLFLCGVSTVSL